MKALNQKIIRGPKGKRQRLKEKLSSFEVNVLRRALVAVVTGEIIEPGPAAVRLIRKGYLRERSVGWQPKHGGLRGYAVTYTIEPTELGAEYIANRRGRRHAVAQS